MQAKKQSRIASLKIRKSIDNYRGVSHSGD